MRDIKTPAIKGKALEILTWIGVAIAIVVVCIVLTKVFKAFKAGATTAGDLAGAIIVSGQTGIPVNRQYVCAEVADQCNDAITHLLFTSVKLYLDREAFTEALNRLETGAEAKLTSELFKQKTGEGLKAAIGDLIYSDPVLSRIKTVVKVNLT